MAQFVPRVVLKSYSAGRCPLRVLFRDALFGYTFEVYLLPFPQFTNHDAKPFRVPYDRFPNPLVGSRLANNQVSCVHSHYVIASAFRAQGQRNRAVFTVLIAFAITGVQDVFYGLAVEWYEA